MLDINLNELIEILGTPTKSAGHQYYFRCPSCAQFGGDTSCDNLLFNERKGVLKCFACEDGAKETLKLLNQWRRDNNVPTISSPQPSPIKQVKLWWEINSENLYQYWCEAYDEMSDRAIEWLKGCGITKQLVDEWMIGYDKDPSILKIKECVAFPMISLNHDGRLVGFELRQMGREKIIRHTYDAPRCLCIINDNKDANKLIICEGFKDAYSMWQILESKGRRHEFTILTPAHGVDDIVNNLKDINFTRYKSCHLVLDNDAAGDRVTQQILQKCSFFKDERRMLHGRKDVNELWLAEYV